MRGLDLTVGETRDWVRLSARLLARAKARTVKHWLRPQVFLR
jgi:hypothetical protein